MNINLGGCTCYSMCTSPCFVHKCICGDDPVENPHCPQHGIQFWVNKLKEGKVNDS